MNPRDTVHAHNFGDLNSDARRLEFAQYLLNTDENSRTEILNDQFNIDPANLDALMEFLSDKQELLNHPAHDKLILEITLVLATPALHNEEFVKLSSAEVRRQFTLGLLLLDVHGRNIQLAQQLGQNPENIVQLHTTLTGDLRGLFERFPSYASLLKNISAVNETLKAASAPPKQTPSPQAAPAKPAAVLEKIQALVIKSEEKPRMDTLTAELNALCEDHLLDPINFEAFENPVITPVGVTHSDSTIKQCLALKNEEPTTRAPLNAADLLPNLSVITLAAQLKKNPIDLARLRDFFTCPLSGEIFTNPVVAADSLTYEHAYITAYLNEHANRLPLIGKTDNRLYPNLFMKSLLALPRIQELLAQHQTPLEKKNAALIKSFRDYQQTRLQEGNYPWFFFTYRKMQKIGIAVDAKRVLQGKMSPHNFFSRHHHDLSALSQGRLGGLGKTALIEMENIRNIPK